MIRGVLAVPGLGVSSGSARLAIWSFLGPRVHTGPISKDNGLPHRVGNSKQRAGACLASRSSGRAGVRTTQAKMAGIEPLNPGSSERGQCESFFYTHITLGPLEDVNLCLLIGSIASFLELLFLGKGLYTHSLAILAWKSTRALEGIEVLSSRFAICCPQHTHRFSYHCCSSYCVKLCRILSSNG